MGLAPHPFLLGCRGGFETRPYGVTITGDAVNSPLAHEAFVIAHDELRFKLAHGIHHHADDDDQTGGADNLRRVVAYAVISLRPVKM